MGNQLTTKSTLQHLQQFVNNELHFSSPNAQQELRTILFKLSQNDNQKEETVVVAFNEPLARAIASGENPDNIDVELGNIEVKTFNSSAEADAYKKNGLFNITSVINQPVFTTWNFWRFLQYGNS